MSTNGTYGFRAGRKTLKRYNHSDSYPTWLGKQMFDFAIKLAQNEDARQDAIDKFAALIVVNDRERPTAEQMALLDPKWHDAGVGNGDDWYSYTRATQGDPEATLDIGFLPTANYGAQEWNYVLNLDTLVLSVYMWDTRVATLDAHGFTDSTDAMARIEEVAYG
jgi:hypothetical protein